MTDYKHKFSQNNCFNHCACGIIITLPLTSINMHWMPSPLGVEMFISKIPFYIFLIILLFRGNHSALNCIIVIVPQLLDYHHHRVLLSLLFGLVESSQVNMKSSIVDMLLPEINLHKTIPFHYSGIKTSFSTLELLLKFVCRSARRFLA